jgi:hypothetical protein
MLLQVVRRLTNQVRARFKDAQVVAVCELLDSVATDIEAGRRKRACKTCRQNYRDELKATKEWTDKRKPRPT